MRILRFPAREVFFVSCLVLAGSLFIGKSFAAFALVDSYNGPENDMAATGQFLASADGDYLGDWMLESSVEQTDFSNAHVGGGSLGLQYTMLNRVFGSADKNSMVFSVSPADGLVPQISMKQSPAFNDPRQWNGGNLPTDISEFTIRWSGGGQAVVKDPAGQFQIAQPLDDELDSVDVSAGTTLTFSDFQIFNSDDEWSVTFPEGATSIEVDWGSSQPTAGSDLTREWVAFDANFVSAVPEPAGATLFVLFGLSVLATARRRRP